MANKQNVTIIKLPPHTTHLLQPLEVSVSKTIAWDTKLIKWQRYNVGRRLPKDMFSKFIAETWLDAKDKIVPREKFDSKALKRWEAQTSRDSLNQPIKIVLKWFR